MEKNVVVSTENELLHLQLSQDDLKTIKTKFISARKSISIEKLHFKTG